MDKSLLYLILGGILVILCYLLWRLNRLEQLLKRYKCKNQEGLGALSRTKSPLWLFLALFQLVYVVFEIIHKGFDWISVYRALFLIGLPLYLFFRDEDR